MGKLRELQLLRHAKSDHKQAVPTDKERVISDKGKKATAKIRQWLLENELIPDYVLVSSAKRTLQTFKRICPDAHIPHQILDELYLASPETMLEALSKVPKKYKRVMLIGHNPGLASLFHFLNNGVEEQSPLFPTSGLAHFILPENWQALTKGDGKLLHFIKPKNLKLSQT